MSRLSVQTFRSDIRRDFAADLNQEIGRIDQESHGWLEVVNVLHLNTDPHTGALLFVLVISPRELAL